MDPPVHVWYEGTRLVVAGPGRQERDRVEFAPCHFVRDLVAGLREKSGAPEDGVRIALTRPPHGGMRQRMHASGMGCGMVLLEVCDPDPVEDNGPAAVGRLTLDQWRGILSLIAVFIDLDDPHRNSRGTDIRFLPRIIHDRVFVLDFCAHHPEYKLPLQLWRDAASSPIAFPELLPSRHEEVPAQECAEIAIARDETATVLASILAAPDVKVRLSFDRLVVTAIAVRRPWMLDMLKRECPVWDEALRRLCDTAQGWFVAEHERSVRLL